jgi:hypothetical protein
MSDYIKDNLHQDGIDRRGVLKCVAWAGTGALCVLQGGVLKSFALSDIMRQRIGDLKGDISFAQISDSDVGFNKAANADVTAILREAIAKVNALPTPLRSSCTLVTLLISHDPSWQATLSINRHRPSSRLIISVLRLRT